MEIARRLLIRSGSRVFEAAAFCRVPAEWTGNHGPVLAVVGLHASHAHLVEPRRREIVIRLAPGAMQSQVVRMILARGGIVVASGLVAGTLSAVIAGLAVRSQLFGVELTDAVTWISVLGALLIVRDILCMFPRMARGADRAVSRASP